MYEQIRGKILSSGVAVYSHCEYTEAHPCWHLERVRHKGGASEKYYPVACSRLAKRNERGTYTPCSIPVARFGEAGLTTERSGWRFLRCRGGAIHSASAVLYFFKQLGKGRMNMDYREMLSVINHIYTCVKE
jgi:hypothetical protein